MIPTFFDVLCDFKGLLNVQFPLFIASIYIIELKILTLDPVTLLNLLIISHLLLVLVV
jgi:hypothetical protein